ncbi:hypothetical protein CRG98_025786 [Punica granatum]|uniref:Uncharacterized protein n=1 Tax=Punica granatum TaxID=22663 RepID=A0A2I0JCY8_PUNGR|nr:hypothetical protein CRG98_025786 [Punica granatum]
MGTEQKDPPLTPLDLQWVRVVVASPPRRGLRSIPLGLLRPQLYSAVTPQLLWRHPPCAGATRALQKTKPYTISGVGDSAKTSSSILSIRSALPLPSGGDFSSTASSPSLTAESIPITTKDLAAGPTDSTSACSNQHFGACLFLVGF